MKRICEYCSEKDACVYLKGKIEYKCPSVQDYDVGYEEAVDKACDVYAKELKEIISILNKVGEMRGIEDLGDILSFDGCIRDFQKAMEEE